MNERIESLFNSAGGYAEKDDKGNCFTYTDNFDPEKFAELIVKECARMCHYQALVESERGSLECVYKERALDAMGKKITDTFGIILV